MRCVGSTDSSQGTLKDSDKLRTNDDSHIALMQWSTQPDTTPIHVLIQFLSMLEVVVLTILVHLQRVQIWQACECSILNPSDGIDTQVPASEHIPSQTTQAPN